VIGGVRVSPHTGIQVTAVFDALTKTWVSAAKMNLSRWYGTGTALPDGRYLATSGDNQNGQRVTLPEIYDPITDRWDVLQNAERDQALYPSMFVLPDGRVYDAGPRTDTFFLDITGEGSWTAGPRNSFGSSGYAECACMYRPGKILRAGGSDPAWTKAAVINFADASPRWRDIAPMNFAGRRHNLVILSDGNVAVIGETRRGDNESDAVLAAEIFNPDTETFTQVASMQEARMYHSAAVLLPDGRVVAGGGEATGRLHAEI
jgi:hypothetical protein